MKLACSHCALLASIAVLASVATTASASSDRHGLDSRLTQHLQVWPGSIALQDQSHDLKMGNLRPHKQQARLYRRQDSSELTVGAALTRSTATRAAASTVSGSATLAGVSAAAASSTTTTSTSQIPPLPSDYTMPQAFDAVLGQNFTSQACPNFFGTFLGDANFKSCYPLSFLLETSTSFFKAMQNATILPSVMQEICTVDTDTCSTTMDRYAAEIVKDSNCGKDLNKGNALAVSALNGFQNYKVMKEAGCLKDDRKGSSGTYCFTEAANATLASDLYLYYLPGGTGLPSGTQPTCDYCSKAVMGAYSNYASNSTLRLSQTYPNARTVVSLSCGPSFAPLVAATTAGTSSALRLSAPPSLLIPFAYPLVIAALAYISMDHLLP